MRTVSPSHRFAEPTALAAMGFVVAPLLAASPSGNVYEGLGELLVIAVLFLLLNGLCSYGSLIAALVMGRKAAPRAPWKRPFAVVLLITGVLSALANVVLLALGTYFGLENIGPAAAVAMLVVFGLPLAASLGTTFASVRLYRQIGSDR